MGERAVVQEALSAVSVLRGAPITNPIAQTLVLGIRFTPRSSRARKISRLFICFRKKLNTGARIETNRFAIADEVEQSELLLARFDF